MRVVITGATGNIGTSLVDALGDDPAVTSIVALARRRPTAWSPPKTEFVEADITRDDLVAHMRGADAVVHLAWLFQPSHDPLLTWWVNVKGSIRVFDAVVEAGVPALVYSSSVGAYSPGPKDRGVDERWPTDGVPTAAYAREKAYVERVLDAFECRQPDVRVVRIRPGFIFKRESAAEQRRLFAGPFLPGRFVRPSLIPVVPDLPGLRMQMLHSADAGEAFRLALTRDVRGAFNIAADPVVDATVLADVLGARVVKTPLRPVRAALTAAWHLHLVPVQPALLDVALTIPVMDTTRARVELGWVPRHTSVDALRALFEGLREGAGGPTPPLDADAGGPARTQELATGVGQDPSVPGTQ